MTDAGQGFVDWDFDGWIGTDENKFWVRSEGERLDGETEEAEFWAMYSHNMAEFWDIQFGLRHDTQPESTSYAVFGFDGLAPYFLETEAHIFFSDDADLSFRLRQEREFLMTQRIVMHPYYEINLFFHDVPELGVGAGLSDLEVGLHTMYEFSHSFGVYIDIKYERTFGETSSIATNDGEGIATVVGTVGINRLF